MSTNQLTPIQKAEAKFESLIKKSQDIVTAVNNTSIETEADLRVAESLLKNCQTFESETESMRKDIVKPFNDFVKQVNGKAKTMVTPVADAKKSLKTKILEFSRIQEEKAKEHQAQQEQVQEEETESEAPAEVYIPPKVKGITKRWTYEILDESQIPREFCSPDSKKINEAIKGGVREVPGLKIFEQEDVR